MRREAGALARTTSTPSRRRGSGPVRGARARIVTAGRLGDPRLRPRRRRACARLTRDRRADRAARRARTGDFFEALLPDVDRAACLSARGDATPAAFGPTRTPMPSVRCWARWTIPAGRGHASAALRAARRANPDAMRAPPACISRSGRRTPRGSRSSAISTNGTDGAARCASASTAAVGDLRAAASARARSTNTRSFGRDGELLPLKADPFGFAAELRPSTASVVARTDDSPGPTPTILRARGQGEPRREPMSIYRGAPRVVAARRRRPLPDLRRTRRAADPLRRRSRLHPPGADAGHRASARRLMGLSADRPVRAHPPVRRSRRLRALRRPRPCGGPRRDPRLGSRAFPDRRAWPGAVRRRAALRERRPAPRLPPRLEHRDLRFRPARSRQFPLRQRALLDRPFSCRRPARRRRRLHALSRLFAQARRMAAQSGRQQRQSRRRRLHATRQRTRLRRLSRRRHDRRGIDGLGGRLARRSAPAASASTSNGTWGGCTTRSNIWRAIRSIGAGATTS